MISIARIFGAPDVVASEVDEHHVLGPLLEIRQKFLLELHVLFRAVPAAPRARERPRLEAPPLDLHELLRRRAHHVAAAAERDEEHVRRRVDRAKAAVHVEWTGRELLAKAL